MISVPASRNISPTISSVYFFSAKITSVTREKRLYHGSSSHLLLGRPRVIRAVPKQESGFALHQDTATQAAEKLSNPCSTVEERRFSAA